jgi:cell division protein FtsI/penicillin-binding protein 2
MASMTHYLYPGQNLITGIDIDLQQYGEFLMKGKAGSIVAIEPASGEILSIGIRSILRSHIC